MRLFNSRDSTPRLQVFCIAWAVSVMLTSLQLPAQAQGKNDSVEHPTFHRTITIGGLSIFYREAGAKDAPTLLLLPRSALHREHCFQAGSRMV